MRTPVALGILLASVMTISGSSAIAQSAWYSGAGGTVPYGIGVGIGGGYGATTAAGSAYDGMSNLVRASGAYNMENAQAALNYQKASLEHQQVMSAYIDNQKKLQNARAEMKRKHQAEQAKDRAVEQEAEERGREFARAHLPQPLSSHQLDPSTGRIDWPEPLKAFDFNDLRQSLDLLFKTRAQTGITDDQVIDIGLAVNKMHDLLHKQILQMPLPEYTHCRRFLDSLGASAK